MRVHGAHISGINYLTNAGGWYIRFNLWYECRWLIYQGQIRKTGIYQFLPIRIHGADTSILTYQSNAGADKSGLTYHTNAGLIYQVKKKTNRTNAGAATSVWLHIRMQVGCGVGVGGVGVGVGWWWWVGGLGLVVGAVGMGGGGVGADISCLTYHMNAWDWYISSDL